MSFPNLDKPLPQAGNLRREGSSIKSTQQDQTNSTNDKVSDAAKQISDSNNDYDPTKHGSTHPFRRSVLKSVLSEASSFSLSTLIAIVMGIFITVIGKPVLGILLIGGGLILN